MNGNYYYYCFGTSNQIFLNNGGSFAAGATSAGRTAYTYYSLTGNTLTWYNSSDNQGALYQLNYSNETYFYIAVG